MPNDRRTVDACYDSVRETQLDHQRWQLEVGDVIVKSVERCLFQNVWKMNFLISTYRYVRFSHQHIIQGEKIAMLYLF